MVSSCRVCSGDKKTSAGGIIGVKKKLLNADIDNARSDDNQPELSMSVFNE
jgi:hypothetical protein